MGEPNFVPFSLAKIKIRTLVTRIYHSFAADEKISEKDRFEFPTKTIFANNSKIIGWRATYKCLLLLKKENGPKDT